MYINYTERLTNLYNLSLNQSTWKYLEREASRHSCEANVVNRLSLWNLSLKS